MAVRRLRLARPPFLAVALALLIEAGAPGPARAAEGPAAPVERLEKVLAEGMAGGLDFRARYVLAAPVVAQTHDLAWMVTARTGADVATFSEADRKAVLNALFRRLTARYAVLFDTERGRSFQRSTAPPEADGTVRVTSLFAGGEAERIELVFTLVPAGDAWKVRAVRLNGKDEAQEERETNAGILQREGVRGLVAAWERWIPRPSTEERATASEVVKRLQDELIAVMKGAAGAGYRARFARLAPVIDETHHLPAIAQLTIRRGWGSLSEEQQRTFVEKFRQLSIARYASRFDAFSGERFEIAEEKDATGGKLVRSALVKSNGERIQFDYLLRHVGDDWRILNITVDGVSDLATKQAEYGSLLQTGGFQALLAKVEEQIRKQESGS